LHFRVTAAALVVMLAGAIALAQKITTPEDLDKVMKSVQTANQAAFKAVKSGAYADAAKQLANVKKGIEDSREFWVTHKKDDAIKFNKDTVAQIEAAEKVLGGANPDATAAMEAMKLVGAACRSCHEPYRVRDADNNWVIKPGSIGG
jgi:cytochrome c556